MAKKKARSAPPGDGGHPVDSFQQELQDRWSELWDQLRAAEEVLVGWKDDLLAIPNVTGFHVGFKRRELTIARPLEYCIRVHVAKKYPQGHPDLGRLLPKTMGGVKLDVMPRVYRTAAAESEFAPNLVGGVAIANNFSEQTRRNWGTLGLLVLRNSKPMFLTNSHVAMEVGSLIVQPPLGTDSERPESIIGKVVSSERSRLIDAAIIEPTTPRNRRPEILTVDKDVFQGPPLSQSDVHTTQVFMVGARTGGVPRRVGVVKSVNSTLEIEKFGTMEDQIVVEPQDASVDLIKPGDSGAALLVETKDRDGYFCVGLVHAQAVATTEPKPGTGGHASQGDNYRAIVACHIHHVVKQLGIQI